MLTPTGALLELRPGPGTDSGGGHRHFRGHGGEGRAQRSFVHITPWITLYTIHHSRSNATNRVELSYPQAYIKQNGEPTVTSGKQEKYESIFNNYI